MWKGGIRVHGIDLCHLLFLGLENMQFSAFPSGTFLRDEKPEVERGFGGFGRSERRLVSFRTGFSS